MAKKLPHLYQKLFDLMREKDMGRYMGRKTLHREVASCFRVNGADIDIAVRELNRRKLVARNRRRVTVL